MPPMRTAADIHHGLLTSMFAVALVFLSPVAGCPGSPAWGTHCSAKLTVNVQQTCSDFTKEVASRVAGVGGWSDPHNSGKYTITGRSDSKLQLQRRTGDEKYTDKMDLGLAAAAGGGCTVTACSESQVASYLDKSTNYCNLRNLYCSSADGCPFAQTDLGYTDHVVKMGAGATHDFSKCVVSKPALCLAKLQGVCTAERAQGAAACQTCAGTHQQELMKGHCTSAMLSSFCKEVPTH